MKNTLYYGDNWRCCGGTFADESVDLIYLDPPFKSEQDYNVLFADQDGSRSAAQIRAFEDTGVGTRLPRRRSRRSWRPAAGFRWPCRHFGRRSATTICWPTCR